jgi:hypothetical protein
MYAILRTRNYESGKWWYFFHSIPANHEKEHPVDSTENHKMPQIHTHYDNLKVSRDAPPEVIRAAYKTLSQKFHPDRNPDVPSATRTFQLISLAYDTLSDPIRRRDHDEWIAQQEALAAAEEQSVGGPARVGARPARGALPIDPHGWRRRALAWQSALRMSSVRTRIGHALHLLAWCVVATIILFGVLSS